MTHGTLYLVPTGLGGSDVLAILPSATTSVIERLEYFVAENPKTARAFLKLLHYTRPLQELRMDTLDEHTSALRVTELLQPLLAGTDCGLLSEAGCPAVADPGAALVRAAHTHAVKVVPLVGPSALLLAVMASGLNGQHFVFHGYLPIERAARARRLRDLENESGKVQVTQIFIEAPYRNDAMLDAILAACRPDTLLCVATDLTLETESVRTQPVAHWKTERPDLNRRPTVFLLYRDRAPAQKR